MKKKHGLYLLTIGAVIFICYFLAASLCAISLFKNDYKVSAFLWRAWPMPVIAAAFAGGGGVIFFRSKE